MSVLLKLLVAQFVIVKVVLSYVQPRQHHHHLQQYVMQPYTRQEPNPVQSHSPYTEYKRYYQQNYPSNYPNYQYQKAEPVPLPIPVLPEITNKVQVTPNLDEVPRKCQTNLDAHVLNNLAIALQLLIVNNIISNGPNDTGSVSRVLELINSDPIPSSNFLGTSNFGNDQGLIGVGLLGPNSVSMSRPGLNLMSPYDAIAKNAPPSESFTSTYLSKKDFQSPYSAIMAADNYKDLFGMSDFY